MNRDESPAPRPGGRAFLRLHSPPHRRVLEPGIFADVAARRWVLHFDAPHFAAEVGEERLLYYIAASDFLVQPVRIESQSADGPPLVLVVVPRGVATSANTRSEPRVDTAGELEATLDDAPQCEVRDVSLSGLAVISYLAHDVGERLDISVHLGTRVHRGKVEVRGKNGLRDKSIRYGLLGLFDEPRGRDLKLGLARATLEFQGRRL